MAEYPQIFNESVNFNSTFQNTLNFDELASLNNQIAQSKNTFTSSIINCDTLNVSEINGNNYNTAVIQNLATINTNITDLSQNIYNNLSVVSLNATGQIKENNLPLNYSQTFKLATGMTTASGTWGSENVLDFNGLTMTSTTNRSDVSCFETFQGNKFRLSSTDYAGIWRVDMKMVIHNTGLLGNFTSVLTRLAPFSEVSTTTFIPSYVVVDMSETHKVYETYNMTSSSQAFYIKTLFDGFAVVDGATVPATKTSTFNITDFQLTFTYLGSATS